MESLTQVLTTLWELVGLLWTLIGQILTALMHWSLLILWLVWAFLGIRWKKMWPTLAAGAWGPFVLLIVAAAVAWSALDPSSCNCLGFMTIPPFWWHLCATSLIAVATMFCGWLQGVVGWEPPEFDLDPPAPSHDHGHH